MTKHNFPFFDLSSSPQWFQSWWQMIPRMLWKIDQHGIWKKWERSISLFFFLSSGLCVLVYCELCTCKEKVQYFRVSLLLVFLAYMACGILIIPNDPSTSIIKHQKRPISKHLCHNNEKSEVVLNYSALSQTTIIFV